MPALRFKQVDVFTARPYFGNPVAVVLDAAGLDTAHLRQFRRGAGRAHCVDRCAGLGNVGPQWLVAELADAFAVRALTPDRAAVTALSLALGRTTGITVFGRCREADHTILTRSFAPAEGIPEDPVCGSGNASVGAFMHRAGVLPA